MKAWTNFFITYIKINSEGVKKKLGWKSQGSHNLHETMGLKQSRKYNYVCCAMIISASLSRSTLKDVRVAMGKAMSEDNFGRACFRIIQ